MYGTTTQLGTEKSNTIALEIHDLYNTVNGLGKEFSSLQPKIEILHFSCHDIYNFIRSTFLVACGEFKRACVLMD
jgi:hypothetical protein